MTREDFQPRIKNDIFKKTSSAALIKKNGGKPLRFSKLGAKTKL
jgi:uncharacterized protein YjhX (UPF0386 family)